MKMTVEMMIELLKLRQKTYNSIGKIFTANAIGAEIAFLEAKVKKSQDKEVVKKAKAKRK